MGTALASPTTLWLLVPFAALGAILPGHPFDVLYNYGLRHVFGAPTLPRYPIRRRLACVMATLMLVAAAWGFQTGMPMVGYSVGWSLVAAAFVNVSTGFCVPSFFVRTFFGKVVRREAAGLTTPSTLTEPDSRQFFGTHFATLNK